MTIERKLLALAFMGVGVAGLTYAARGQGQRPIGIVAAMAVFAVAASLISPIGALAVRLRPFIGKTVTVRAWENPLPDAETFEVISVRAISAALHIYLQPIGGSPIHLKVAQPRRAQVTESTILIDDAKYLQWAGRKLPRSLQRTSPALIMEAKN